MARRLRLGIIGCGTVSPSHVESYLRAGNVEVAWTCDLVPERARMLAERYHVPRVTADYRELLSDPGVDCVSICTDHASHAPLTIAAFEAGKHVLCEKPIVLNAAAMKEVFDAHAKRPELVYAGVFQHRFDRSIRLVKELVDGGVFGTIVTCGVQVRCRRDPPYYRERDWRGTWQGEGGSVTMNQALHSIDVLVWAMGGVKAVCGAFTNLRLGGVIETEDTAAAVLRFASGALGTVETTASSSLGWENTLFLHGAEGCVELRDGQPIKLHFREEALLREVSDRFKECRDPDLIRGNPGHYGKTHPAQIADFIAAIREGREPFVTPRSAFHTVQVVLGIYQSHREGRWVEIA
ncbi:MAG: Gfo/Idh/MocA family oxidoreductase [Planctomycetota bacterium]